MSSTRHVRALRKSGWQADDVGSRFVKRRWEEPRGDQFTAWGASTWYFEFGEDGHAVRQIEIYDDGPTLRYGADHAEDEFGCLSESRFEGEDWTAWEIPSAEFERAWASTD